MRCKTVYLENAVDENEALSLFTILKEGVEWEEGVRSKKGFTRKAFSLHPLDIPILLEVINNCLTSMTKTKYEIVGIYLNLYENGDMFTPNHKHAGTHQLVISLGAQRTLTIGKKSYPMKNGDAVLFGTSIHGVPKEPSIKEARISIATFMVPLSS